MQSRIQPRSHGAKRHPLQQGKRAVKSSKAVLSPTKVGNFFQELTQRAAVYKLEHALFEMRLTEHAQFKVMVFFLEGKMADSCWVGLARDYEDISERLERSLVDINTLGLLAFVMPSSFLPQCACANGKAT